MLEKIPAQKNEYEMYETKEQTRADTRQEKKWRDEAKKKKEKNIENNNDGQPFGCVFIVCREL